MKNLEILKPDIHGLVLSDEKTSNTHFKTDVKDKPCHGLNASYAHSPLGWKI